MHCAAAVVRSTRARTGGAALDGMTVEDGCSVSALEVPEFGGVQGGAAEMAWSVLSGVIEQYFDQQLLDLGRNRHWLAVGKGDESYELIDPDVATVRMAFLAHRNPWRLALINLDGGGWPPIIGWAGEAWAGLDAYSLAPIGDAPAPGRNATTHGDLCVRTLLVPDWLHFAIDGPIASNELELTSLQLLAAAQEQGSTAGCLSSLGTDRYQVNYDPTLDVITSWTSTVDGELARRDWITDLHVVQENTRP
jgi:hypothetical protein